MKVGESTFKKMPTELQALFQKLPNPWSEEVVSLFPESNNSGKEFSQRAANSSEFFFQGSENTGVREFGDSGSAARFFYCAKSSRRERGEGNNHPTVKPLKLIEYLVKLICPPGGVVLDPFLGSGTTALACLNLGRECVGIEQSEEYFEIACKRIEEWNQ